MNRLSIANIGPINEANLDLNKINVFIGPQNCGKSIIAKALSYCQWVEKRYILDDESDPLFLAVFMEFYGIDNGFMSEDSRITYETENIYIESIGCDPESVPKLRKKNKGDKYLKFKHVYIPAERNFTSTTIGVDQSVSEFYYILNYTHDWLDVCQDYSRKKTLPILNLGIEYYYNGQRGFNKSMLHIKGNGIDIGLEDAPSGVKSLVSLLLPFDRITADDFLWTKVPSTITEKEKSDALSSTFNSKGGFECKDLTPEEKGVIRELYDIIRRRRCYHFSQFVIEEPEQNLSPETQRDLIYYLLEKISGERDHKLLITTHSPYILSALNNCMMAGLVYDKMDDESKAKIKCKKSRISPSKVKVYEIRDGKVECIQQEDGLIGENYLDQMMKEIMDEYHLMLNYY